MLKLEVGKTYRTRDGRKAGPLQLHTNEYEISEGWLFVGPIGLLSGCGSEPSEIWKADGRWGWQKNPKEYGRDIVAEWQDEPLPSLPTPDLVDISDALRYVAGPFTVPKAPEWKPVDLSEVEVRLVAASAVTEKPQGLMSGAALRAAAEINTDRIYQTFSSAFMHRQLNVVCRCPTLLNGHHNGCPMARGVR